MWTAQKISLPKIRSGKWKLKCTCPKAIFSKIHLPGQVLMLYPDMRASLKNHFKPFLTDGHLQIA